ncbi:MAG TPA: hypothetical protein VNG31_04095 [Candidatus Baltobacteraceae bacterium]|nr:hypothetical protein [Candidatus Baltobacteraceae bacterium]
MSGENVAALRRLLLQWYRKEGRAELPWRSKRDPYYTLVSEFMLQQTQVDRVVPKFEAFVQRFPDMRALAAASTSDVLRAWKGLGYNSRAVRLKRVAQAVVEKHGGVVPSDAAALRALPGIGPYTAAAIRAFAFDLADAAIDTNVRRVIGRVFFAAGPEPLAAEIGDRARAWVPRRGAHDWNSALMDLGAAICSARAPKCLLCPLRSRCASAPLDVAALGRARVKRSRPPSSTLPFEATSRYARGRLVDRLRELPPGETISLLDLHFDLAPMLPGRSADDVRDIVHALERDGLVRNDGDRIALRD